ncbi:hypothetical protein PanWU01x14_108670, partial [Parasponia andersonii]
MHVRILGTTLIILYDTIYGRQLLILVETYQAKDEKLSTYERQLDGRRWGSGQTK